MLVILSDGDLPIEEASSKQAKRELFRQRVQEAQQLVEELQDSGITETQDLIRELRNRFPANVVSKVLGVSGRELRGTQNADKRVEEATSSTALEILEAQAKELTKEKIQRWLDIGKAVDELNVDEYASGRGLSVRDYLERTIAFYQTFFPVIKERVDEILA
jgi:hypothetical protein